MLKPVDVVSLVLAARITTTAWERSKYLNLFRHIFSDDIWVERMKESGGTVSVIGKDIRRFHRALRTWDYHALNDKMNLLLVVKQPMLTPQARFQENGNLLDNIDGTCLWTTGFTVGPTICKRSNTDSENLEVYVMFTNRNIRIALNAEWTNRCINGHSDLYFVLQLFFLHLNSILSVSASCFRFISSWYALPPSFSRTHFVLSPSGTSTNNRPFPSNLVSGAGNSVESVLHFCSVTLRFLTVTQGYASILARKEY